MNLLYDVYVWWKPTDGSSFPRPERLREATADEVIEWLANRGIGVVTDEDGELTPRRMTRKPSQVTRVNLNILADLNELTTTNP